MNRRIQEICGYHEIPNLKIKPKDNDWQHLSSPLREDYGDSLFPHNFEICGKVVEVTHTTEFGENGTTYILRHFACGHFDTILKKEYQKQQELNLLYDNLLPFQREFVEFAENAGCRVLCSDEMGLGKTVEALTVLRENARKFTDNFTKFCIIVTPTGGIYQWEEECRFWLDLEHPSSFEHLQMAPQVVCVARQNISPLSKVIIIPWSRISDPHFVKQVKGKVGSLIVDEAHFFKDVKAARTKALIELIQESGTQAPLLFLTGTPVENRIMELKVALNALDPNYFYSWEVLERFCTHSREGKALGIAPYLRDRFFQKTSKYMIGRKKSEVNIPLPKIEYHKLEFEVSEFEANKQFVGDYNQVLKDLRDKLEHPNLDAGTIIGYMQQLRHHTGKMKILGAAAWIECFLMDHPNEQLAVGIHHKAVRETLAALLSHHKPLQMSDENAKVKDEIEQQFRSSKSRLLICSILSAGVGRNLQFCRNAIILERQWNKSKESQYAQRFWRIMRDSDGRVRTFFDSNDTVHIYTANLKDSFDEFFDSMIHLKGLIVDSIDDSLDEEQVPDDNFMLELATQVVARRMKWVNR